MTLWKPVQDKFGEDWQRLFAEYLSKDAEIKTHERTVRRWFYEESPIPGAVLRVIESLKKSG